MTDIKGTPGGNVFRRDQMYRDDGDGTHSESRASNLWIWDTTAWRKATPADFTGGSVSITGNITSISSDETSTIYSGTTALTPKFATIALSATGTVVAAVGGKKIRVLSYVLVSNGNVNVKWQSHVIPTDKSGLLYLVANTGAAVGYSPVGHFETISGEALDLNLSASIAVGGHLVYLEV